MNIGEFELKASCKAYCDLKQKIGAPNLKVKFLTAYEQGDLDFFADVVMSFANPKPKSKQAVFEFEEAPGKISKSGSVDGAGRVRHMVAPGGYV